MDQLAAFAANVRSLREQRGLSQAQLAELSDLHVTEVGRIERADRDPGVRTIARLARGLGVAPTQLLEDVYADQR